MGRCIIFTAFGREGSGQGAEGGASVRRNRLGIEWLPRSHRPLPAAPRPLPQRTVTIAAPM